MMRVVLACLAGFVFLSAGCPEIHHTGEGEKPPGAMTYAAYDATGRLAAIGWIRLDIVAVQVAGAEPPQPADFTGDWCIRALVDPDRIGPQNGAGFLKGQFTAEGVGVNLNPNWIDNNVTLTGLLTVGGPAPMRFKGKWTWTTIAGIRAEGTFAAVE